MAIVLLLGAGSYARSQVVLVSEGKPKATIALAPDASPSMKHGAEELQSFVEQMSGARLPILQLELGHQWPETAMVLLTSDKVAAPEEFWIQTRRNRLTIRGGAQRGVMYGCYSLLEDWFGCRFYTKRHTFVPKQSTIAVRGINTHQKPAFEYREPYFTEALDRNWAARNRCNGSSMDLDDSVGSRVIYGKFVHTFSELVPPSVYFDKHPEYFSLVNGKRLDGYHQLCLTNPDVLKITIDKVRQWIKENPGATIFSVSQNDTYDNCQCDRCKAVEREEGAPSGVLLRFVNAVADAIGKDYPNVLIDTLAYQWSEKPPLHVRPRKNVRIRLAPISACFSHPLDGCDQNKDPYANLLSWSKISDQLYVWHYTTNFAHYLQPFPNLDEIAGDVPLFAKNHVVGFFDEGAYAPGGGGEMAELKSYLLAKLMWDPSRPVKPIVSDYLNGVYGKAAPFMQQWLDLLHAPGREGKAHIRIFDATSAPYLSNELVAAGQKIFDSAEAAVSDDPASLDEVQRARLGIEEVQLLRLVRGTPEYEKLAVIVAAKIRKYGYGQVSEGQPVSEFLKSIGQ